MASTTQRMLFAVGSALAVPIFIVDMAHSTNNFNKITGNKSHPLVKDAIGSAIIKTGVYCTSFALFPKATIFAGFGYLILFSGVFDDYNIGEVRDGVPSAPSAPSAPPESKTDDKLR